MITATVRYKLPPHINNRAAAELLHRKLSELPGLRRSSTLSRTMTLLITPRWHSGLVNLSRWIIPCSTRRR